MCKQGEKDPLGFSKESTLLTKEYSSIPAWRRDAASVQAKRDNKEKELRKEGKKERKRECEEEKRERRIIHKEKMKKGFPLNVTKKVFTS